MSYQIKNILIVSFIAVINTFLLFFVKYYQNNLSLVEFSISKTGNFISIFLLIIFIIGAFLLLKQKDSFTVVKSRMLITFSILYLLPIFVIIIFNFVDFKFADEYLLGYPLKKIIPAIFFVFNQAFFLFVLFLIWFTYLGYPLLSYFFSSVAVGFTIILFLAVSFICTFFTSEFSLTKNQTKFDYGIILGAAVWSKNRPSPIFSGRIEKGAELYKKGIVERLQLTGGNAPGELSEAKTAFNYLNTIHKIPKTKIFIEEKTSTTNEQIRFIKNEILEKNKAEKFLIISDQFHLKRIEEMADFYNLNAEVISSNYKLNMQKSFYYRFRDCVSLVMFWFFAI
ncbi:MAG: YdcF family protein [Ignavibacteriae bacterium]|nr:YdcF family protein [Ignavibacteriota bacterium]